MTPQPRPEAVDATIAHFLPELTSLADPTYEKNWATVRALHFLSGALMWDTITGDDLNRLLHSISAIATARRRELNDQELAVEQAHRDLARAAA
jgi:hypothetical protein